MAKRYTVQVVKRVAVVSLLTKDGVCSDDPLDPDCREELQYTDKGGLIISDGDEGEIPLPPWSLRVFARAVDLATFGRVATFLSPGGALPVQVSAIRLGEVEI